MKLRTMLILVMVVLLIPIAYAPNEIGQMPSSFDMKPLTIEHDDWGSNTIYTWVVPTLNDDGTIKERGYWVTNNGEKKTGQGTTAGIDPDVVWGDKMSGARQIYYMASDTMFDDSIKVHDYGDGTSTGFIDPDDFDWNKVVSQSQPHFEETPVRVQVGDWFSANDIYRWDPEKKKWFVDEDGEGTDYIEHEYTEWSGKSKAEGLHELLDYRARGNVVDPSIRVDGGTGFGEWIYPNDADWETFETGSQTYLLNQLRSSSEYQKATPEQQAAAEENLIKTLSITPSAQTGTTTQSKASAVSGALAAAGIQGTTTTSTTPTQAQAAQEKWFVTVKTPDGEKSYEFTNVKDAKAFASTLPKGTASVSSGDDAPNQVAVDGVHLITHMSPDGNEVIGYSVFDGKKPVSKTLLSLEDAEKLARQKVVSNDLESKGYKVVGETEDGELIVRKKGEILKTSITKDGTRFVLEGEPQKLGTEKYVLKETTKSGITILTHYQGLGDGKSEFEYAEIEGSDVKITDEQVSLPYVMNAIKSAGKNAKVEKGGNGFILYNGERKTLSYLQDGKKELFTQYDSAGREKRTFIRNDVGERRETTEETLYNIKQGKDNTYTAEGITYMFSYSGGSYNSRQMIGYKYVEYDENGNKKADLTLPVVDGNVDTSSVTDANLKSEIEKRFSRSVWRSRFAAIDYAFDTFSGLGFYSSLFMSDEDLKDWRDSVDEIFNNVILGGPRYWTSEICENQYDMSSDSLAYGEMPDGLKVPAAHVEGEKSSLIPIPYGDQVLKDGRLYKMSFYAKASFEDIAFNVYLVGPQKATPLFKSNIILEGDEDDGDGQEYVFNCQTNRKCAQYSFNDYDTICLVFEDPGDLEVDELCNTIIESDYSYNNYQDADDDLMIRQNEPEVSAQDSKNQEPEQI